MFTIYAATDASRVYVVMNYNIYTLYLMRNWIKAVPAVLRPNRTIIVDKVVVFVVVVVVVDWCARFVNRNAD